MLPLVIAMFICLALAVVVVGIVALPARREGREVFTPRAEQVVSKVGRVGRSLQSAGSRKAS